MPRFEAHLHLDADLDADAPDWLQSAMRLVWQLLGELQEQLRGVDARVDIALKKQLMHQMGCCSSPPALVPSEEIDADVGCVVGYDTRIVCGSAMDGL